MVGETRRVGAIVAGSGAGRRRSPEEIPRIKRVNARYSEEEYRRLRELADAARMAVSAYVAQTSLAAGPAPSVMVGSGEPQMAGGHAQPGVAGEQQAALLIELMGVHRQLRGACTNLNQAVAKFHSTGEAPVELGPIAAYVRRVTTQLDDLIAAAASEPGARG